MDFVDVIAVGKVEDVGLQGQVVGQRVAGHGVEDDVARHLLDQAGGGIQRYRGTGRAAVDIVAAATDSQTLHGLVGRPQIEEIVGYVGQPVADSRRIVLRLNDFTVHVGVAG